MTAPLLRVENVSVDIPRRRDGLRQDSSLLRAVDGVSLDVEDRSAMGLVGESGCGKTTLGLGILNWRQPTAGRVLLDGRDIATYSRQEWKRYRRDVQMVFQDPMSALNPRMTLRQIVSEPMLVHGLCKSRHERATRAAGLLHRCGLARSMADQYPYALSGGQQQRVAVARALAAAPRLIIADEPTSALDVSVQSQMIGLLRDLQAELGIAYLFISHDLAVVRQIAADVAVMQAGRIVETGPTAAVFAGPTHPYTRHLLDSYVLPDRPGGSSTPTGGHDLPQDIKETEVSR